MDTIKIKCPHCGANLVIDNIPNIACKKITCPVCKETSPFVEYKRSETGEGTNQKMPEDDEPTCYQYSNTNGNFQGNRILGQIKTVGTEDKIFDLELGENIIGRQANQSVASIQIPMEGRRTSREHLMIEVKDVPGKGYVHAISLFKKSCNETYINQEPLEYGDIIILRNGDLIRMPDMNLVFIIPNEEATIR